MDPFIIGFLIVFVIFFAGGFFLFSSATGATTLKTASLVGTGSGIIGTVTMVFSDAWKFITASLYGHLGLYGWILIIGLVLCLGVWIVNGYADLAKGRQISFIE